MSPLTALLVSAILAMATVFAWYRVMTIDNGLGNQRARIERWFVTAAIMTTLAIVWTILSLMSMKEASDRLALGAYGTHPGGELVVVARGPQIGAGSTA